MNSKWYWLIRQKYRNLKFQIKKAAFRLNERKESSERLSSFSRIVIRTLLVQVAINLVLVAVLYVGDKLLLSAMEIFAKTQTDPLIAALSESILVDIVIGGIGVAGVILGLYCSNMTSVYSSKYTNAPATISSAFQRDVVTNRCIKQITGYIIFCVIILFGCLIGISFSYVSIIALLFLTIRMIITFSITGNRMYQLSNTFNISDNLYPEIYSAIRKISANADMLQYRFLDYMLQKLNNGFEPLRQEFGFVGRIITPLPRINYSQHLAEYHDGKINASQLGDVILKKNLRN